MSDLKYTIFSIDAQAYAPQLLAFFDYFDTVKNSMKGDMKYCLGCYKGEQEHSWIMLSEDFDNFILHSGFVDNQESVLRVSSCNKMYGVLEYLAALDNAGNGKTEYIGCMKQVTATVAHEHDAYTYRPDMGVYWVAVKDNPNRRPEELA